MLTLNFYNLCAVLMILVLVSFSSSQSVTNRFLIIFLGATLTSSVFDTSSTFLSPLLDSPSEMPFPDQCFSPAEKTGYYCIERIKYWGDFGATTAFIVVSSQNALTVLRRLEYTHKLVEKLTKKGFPTWLFSFITSRSGKELSEKNLFNLMVSALALNFLILFMFFNLV